MAQQQNKVGSIGSDKDIELTLHTKSSIRLWNGRKAKEGEKYGVLGFAGFARRMKMIEDNIQNDDPYALYHFDQVQKAVKELESFYLSFEDDIQAIMATVPKSLKIPDVSSTTPIIYPVKFASRVGFAGLYQLIKLDELVLEILKAAHIAKISSKEKSKMIYTLENKMRYVFGLTFKYRFMDVTRDDIAANNAKAQRAIEALGEIPTPYLTGEIEVDNAPRLPANREVALLVDAVEEEEEIETLDEVLDDLLDDIDDAKASA